ncbi:hypothetical protein JVU11DRAFT_10621 [Chiua virens]|nr:hypothetical protein JVU11DRAFT_10621 [Chiua virens]
MNQKMLSLAQLSRSICTAKMHYQHLRMQELEMMKEVVENQYEDTQFSLNQTHRQIGEIRRQLYNSGGITACGETGPWSSLFNSSTSRACGFNEFSSSALCSSVSISGSIPPSPVSVKVNQYVQV